MTMFGGRKKEVKEVRRRNPNSNLSKYGLLDMPGIDGSGFNINGGDDEDDDDDAFEAELLALTSGTTPVQRKKKPAPPPTENLDSMVAESLRDVPSDDDVSVDENDPTLLSELKDLVDSDNDEDDKADVNVSPIQTNETKLPEKNILSLLQDRLKMYEEAEKNAKTVGETMRARRFSRGIKTLNNMIKQASAGRVVNEEEIPPPVVTVMRKKSVDIPSEKPEANLHPSRPAPPPPNVEKSQGEFVNRSTKEHSADINREDLSNLVDSNVSDSNVVDSNVAMETEEESIPANMEMLKMLLDRRNEFKEAALQSKRIGDSEKALRYVKVVKQFEPVIEAAKAGQLVDMNSIPPPPQEYDLLTSNPVKSSVKEDSEHQKSPNSTASMVGEVAEMMANAAAAAEEENSTTDEPILNDPPAPSTVLEALEQRLAKYCSAEQAAKEEGNSSKVRRMGRIVKQYEGAIKMHKAGKPIPLNELPTPPGFAPIPVEGSAAPPASVPTAGLATPVPVLTPASPLTPRTEVSPQPAASLSSPNPDTQSKTTPKANVRKSPQSRQEKQLALLIARQKKFKEAAIDAKHKGEINQAKEYLRIMKGFDPLIEASQNGLPIDLASLPIPPEDKVELETGFDIVTLEDCIPGSDTDIYEKLEEELLRQTKMCLTTRDHFKATGDIASANRFEQLALHSKKDLDAVRCAHKRCDSVPKFHFENRTFSIVQCCTDLGDNDLELSIVQGINYNVPNPKEVDTYVKFEFPYPTETPVRDRTGVIKDTNNPQYSQTFMLSIQRNVRACQRVFKRQAIKMEVWSRGGFFRGDSLIGTASVKLMPLETKCIIHDAFDLMEGRRTIGGKLEVKIRLNHPILTKQVEKVQEKWLVIDQYL